MAAADKFRKLLRLVVDQSLDERVTRLSLYFDDDQDNQHTEFVLGENRPAVSHRLRQLADLVDAGATGEEFEAQHRTFKQGEGRNVHDVREYLVTRCTALEHDARKVRAAPKGRNVSIAVGIETEVARIRWAIGYLEDPEL